jgi:hypothetical protein
MLFWNKICGFTAIFFLTALFSSAQELSYVKFSVKKQFPPVPFSINRTDTSSGKILPGSISLIPKNYYTEHFGIMCRKELAFEKATKIPLRFRLGSLAQCNYLEGKK